METDMLTLHGLVIKKAGTATQIASILGVPEADVQQALGHALSAGDVVAAGEMYMPTPVGRDKLDASYGRAYADVRSDAAFVGAADRFESINKRLLDLLTRWQTVPQAGTTVPNDHSDVAYDNAILDELGDLHDRAEATLQALADGVSRIGLYSARLAAAYDRSLAGELDYVSGVRVDSYHTVWHELHEDLLRILGRDRQE